MKNISLCLALGLVAVTAVAVPAESVGTTGTSAVVKPGERVEFYAAPAEVPQKAVILRNGKEAVSREFAAGVRPELSVTAESGVWYLFRVTREGTAAPQEYGVICDPLSIRPATERPADFDAVWAAELAEMRKVPIEVLSWKKWPDPKPGFESAEIAVSFLPGLPPVTGWISWPTNAAPKSLKMVVGIPGAGYCGYGKPLCGYVDGAISFFPNVHGVPNQDYDPRKWDAFAHETGNYFTRESWIAPFKDCYYRKVVLRIIRGFDYLKTLEKWNGRDLDLSSASQGGALSVIAAALVPEITSVRADVTAMCDHGGEKLGRQAGWPQPLAKYGATAEERARGYDQLRYLDVCHFAPRVKCPVTVFTGLQDTICSPTSVFAMFNSLPATTPRKITVSPLAGHAQYGRKTETAFEKVGLAAKDIRIRDPFVVADTSAGVYRLYSSIYAKKNDAADGFGNSGYGVEMYTSGDLETWTRPTAVLELPKDLGCSAVWAPEVHEYNGRWYLFATLTFDGQKLPPHPGWREHVKRGTWIFFADRPEGPFRIVKRDSVTPPAWSALDGTLVVESGKPYMVFCHEWTQIVDGEMCLMPLKDDLSDAAGEPVTLFKASSAPDVKADALVTDGPSFFRDGPTGDLLMIWSTLRKNGAYCVYWSRSETGRVAGPWTPHKMLFEKNGGHGMLFRLLPKAGGSGSPMLTLHQPNNPYGAERMRIFELRYDGGVLSVGQAPK